MIKLLKKIIIQQNKNTKENTQENYHMATTAYSYSMP